MKNNANETTIKNHSIGRDFITCGLCGWCIEVVWTGLGSFINHDKKMMGNTSILMFPIYGLGSFIKPLSKALSSKHIAFRGIIYTICIFTVEYISGYYLKLRQKCPWDYSKSKYNVNGLIRLDYAPAWFAVGLLFEKLLNSTNSRSH